ncbi:MAG: cysteine--tRNA ligase [Candidatus Fournierella pullistercoris]|uniref:Mini-ribonuclease 3 n=1 Tax=Candidatus Allofournierella pullistercoris TaxID=2838597 RepID=A0A948WSA2_9FIRM|nr:cysteine--tRNA ligase [Candidatus Fournierella pullistercoris]
MLFQANPEIDIREQSPLNLAFVGDGVFELLVRQRLVERTRMAPGKLHATCIKYVSAKGQNRALATLEGELTQTEQDVLRRGKNASKASVAKHATPQEYRASTGFEALFGWLYLTGQNDRILELFDLLWERYDPAAPVPQKIAEVAEPEAVKAE